MKFIICLFFRAISRKYNSYIEDLGIKVPLLPRLCCFLSYEGIFGEAFRGKSILDGIEWSPFMVDSSWLDRSFQEEISSSF